MGKTDTTAFSENSTYPYVGCPLDSDSDFDKTNGVTLTSDYTPDLETYGYIRGIMVGGSGNLHVVFYNGGEMILPVVVASSDFVEVFRGFQIVTIKSDSTTTCTKVFPLF